MRVPVPRFVVPVLLAASLPATAALAQTQSQPPAAQPEPKAEAQKQGPRARLSPEARSRLLDGRMAMIKETLKLNDTQLRLWAPVEQHIRARVAARQKRRQERAERRQQGAAPPSLPDRLDRAAQRIGERAERLKAFNTVFKPFYASLSEEQKSLARVVLREARGGRHSFHGRWARRDAPAAAQQ
jgi:LTXXQ motif family protein